MSSCARASVPAGAAPSSDNVLIRRADKKIASLIPARVAEEHRIRAKPLTLKQGNTPETLWTLRFCGSPRASLSDTLIHVAAAKRIFARPGSDAAGM